MNCTQFCCPELMQMAVEPEAPFQYEPEKRRFRIWSPAPAFQKKNQPIFIYDVFFCPKCGKELPKELTAEWSKILHDEFKIRNTFDQKQLAKLPAKYLTEDWWKEKGL